MEGSIEAVGSKKVPLWIRISLGIILLVSFLGVCTLLFAVGIESLKDNTVFGILLLICGVVILLAVITAIVKIIRKRNA